MKNIKFVPVSLTYLFLLSSCSFFNQKAEVCVRDIAENIVFNNIESYKVFFSYPDIDDKGNTINRFSGMATDGYKHTPTITYKSTQFTMYDDGSKSAEIVTQKTIDASWDSRLVDFNEKYYLLSPNRFGKAKYENLTTGVSFETSSGIEYINERDYLIDKNDGKFYLLPNEVSPLIDNFYIPYQERFPTDSEGNIYLKSKYPYESFTNEEFLRFDHEHLGCLMKVNISDPNNIKFEQLTPRGREIQEIPYVFPNGDVIVYEDDGSTLLVKDGNLYPIEEFSRPLEGFFYGYDRKVYYLDYGFIGLGNKVGYLTETTLVDGKQVNTRIEDEERYIPFVDVYSYQSYEGFPARLYANGIKTVLAVDESNAIEMYNEERKMQNHTIASFGLQYASKCSASDNSLFVVGNKVGSDKNDTLVKVDMKNNYVPIEYKSGKFNYQFIKAIDDDTVFYVGDLIDRDVQQIGFMTDKKSSTIDLEKINIYSIVAHS